MIISIVIHVSHTSLKDKKSFYQFWIVKTVLMQIQFYREHIVNAGFVTRED